MPEEIIISVELRFEPSVGLDDTAIDIRRVDVAQAHADGAIEFGDGDDQNLSEDYWGYWYIIDSRVVDGIIHWTLDYKPAHDEADWPDEYEDRF